MDAGDVIPALLFALWALSKILSFFKKSGSSRKKTIRTGSPKEPFSNRQFPQGYCQVELGFV